MTYCPIEPTRVLREWIPDGDAGIMVTLERMAELAIGAAGSPLLARTGGHILRLRGPEAFRRWLDRHFVYESDPPGVELLRDPVLMAESIERCGFAAGDCDDATLLAAGFALSVGWRVKFVVVAFGQWTFEHVWAELADPTGGEWYEMDVTRPAQIAPGAHVVRRKELEV